LLPHHLRLARPATVRLLYYFAFGILAALCGSPAPAHAQNPDLPPATPTPLLAPAGTLVLAMDNANQSSGGIFNLKAYGLAVHLLNNKVPLRWIIRSGKGKDETDFTAPATQAVPRANGAAVARSFRAGPLLVLPRDTAGVRALAAAFNAAQGTTVQVYALARAATVDVRYVLNQRPVAAILNDGGNAAIHQRYMRLAGISGNDNVAALRPQDNYATQAAVNLDSQTDCFTFASEPHSTNTAGGVVEAIGRFVGRGGNFLAECEAVVTYENYANGRFQTTSGVADADVRDNGARRYPAPDQPFSQFEGEFKASTLGGSVTNWRLASGSSFQHGGHPHDALASPNADVMEASVADQYAGRGGLVFYLGGHQYSGTTESDLNGQRLYLNAFLTPATTYQSCNVFADLNGNQLATSLRYTICQGDSVLISLPAGPSGLETYTWSPATGLRPAAGSPVWARPATSTSYSVQATSAGGAVRYLGVEVGVLPAASVSITYENCLLLAGQSITLQASPAGTGYRWDFGDGTPATAESRHTYERPGSYRITLQGTSVSGCPVRASTQVEVADFKVPNIFTPNADGHNETFRILGLPAGTASLQVFNRWGRCVYTAEHYAHDWTGAGLAAGMYYYLLRPAGCTASIKGWVELLR
jgi:gliding motility-associated-like protein